MDMIAWDILAVDRASNKIRVLGAASQLHGTELHRRICVKTRGRMSS